MSLRLVLLSVAGLVGAWMVARILFKDRVDYNEDVKPILNKHCIGCHGGVKKAGDISFLFEHEVYEPGKSGKIPVVKGKWKESEMMRRVLTDDPDDRMPKDAAPLSEEEIETLKNWIDQGAEWGMHWAYEKAERPEVPSVRRWDNLFGLLGEDSQWVRNEIDHFVLPKLREQQLSYNGEAERATLIRRLSLDLTGLPPTPGEVSGFVNDPAPDAYEKVVDRLLQSTAYGEKWASMWMDLARYADTKGYEKDTYRNIWRYRDYVIRSFNEDKPFDEFTIEQLAGDLVEDANGFPEESKLIATAFHRNTMTNDEGGTQDEEFRVAAVIDRVNATWEIWQGTTFACVQCHSHTYDPISHDEYYKYMAFFNNTRDEDVQTETPTLRLFDTTDSLTVDQIKKWVGKYDVGQAGETFQFLKVMEPKVNSHDFVLGDHTSLLDSKFFAIQDNGSASLPELTLTGKDRMLLAIGTGSENAVMNFYTDRTKSERILTLKVPRTESAWRDTVLILPVPEMEGRKSLFIDLENPKAPRDWVMIKWIAFQKELPGESEPGYEEIRQQYRWLVNKKVESTPVMWEARGDLTRETHVFERGNWLVKGEKVTPAVPELFFQLPDTYPKDRLGLARWMVHRDNPLTSRVIVNRFWEQLFGQGIVETLEDFGSQGAPPTHKELLDWLAVTFMEEYKWSSKALLKTIVMSATYRQSSETTPEKTEKDPYNYWLARGPRVRLSAEQIRDQALAVSGLLSPKLFGPSVMPPQPEGVWLSPYSGESWKVSEGEDRYRRGLYTFWKRTAPYPSMATFDAPSREFCQSRRIRTNTPLQALVTLNDPVYLEAAENLAVKMLDAGDSVAQQLEQGYYWLTYRPLSPQKQQILTGTYQEALERFEEEPEEVGAILQHTRREDKKLAALTVAANVLLNLDEVVTKD